MEEKNIMVTIICNTFNHEKYIGKCLDSFVDQKTSFKYEIIVHDDASTDNTAEIIKAYQRKYPNLFKVIIQEKNIYSQNIDSMTYIEKLIDGKYIALCEGDDYWTDERKLQKQVEFLENNNDYFLCGHQGIKIAEDGKYISEFFKDEHEYAYDTGIDDPQYTHRFHTSSMVFKREFFENYRDILKKIKSYDYVYKYLMSMSGKVKVLPEKMSAYRMNAVGSWSERVMKNKEKQKVFFEEQIQILKILNEYSMYAYRRCFEREILFFEYKVEECSGNYKKLKIHKFADIYKKQDMLYKIKNNIKIVLKTLKLDSFLN